MSEFQTQASVSAWCFAPIALVKRAERRVQLIPQTRFCLPVSSHRVLTILIYTYLHHTMSLTKTISPASSVPNITELRRQLQYGNNHPTFSDDIKMFRKNYRTPSGLVGMDLYDWSSPQHQAALEEMTNAYLEQEGRGNLYWPDDRTSANLNILQYSRDHSKIKTLTKQLMFRLNQQQYRNHKYKGKERSGGDETHERDRSVTDPINVDGSDSKSNNPFGSHPGIWIKYDTVGKSSSSEKNRVSSTTAQANPASVGVSVNVSGTKDADEEDVYTVPLSPEPLTSTKQHRITTLQFPSQSAGSSDATASSNKRAAEPVDCNQTATSSKRTRPSSFKPNGDGSYSLPTYAAKKSAPGYMPRNSPRGRKARQKPDCATDEQIREAIGSPTESEIQVTTEQDEAQGQLSNASTDTHVENVSPNLGDQAGQPSTESGSKSTIEPENTTTSAATPLNTAINPLYSSVPPTPTSMEGSIQPATNEATPPKPTPAPKPTISFVYSVISSRVPILQTKLWQPKGKFQDKTLANVFHELELDENVHGLVFTLEGPGCRSEGGQIDRDDEVSFEGMKRMFNKQIRACVASHASNSKPLLFEFEIEPLKGEEPARGPEAEEEDFIW
ncbi:uncharacterized protein BDZ99DRAFT_253876 [Mytilinidion resinicola]|uniref:Uncharacterized protein n=1 Tax=Mytilinidion resinicola TaxID=574789 RepID=A0A6A6YWJ0_9PEZI|nr:uncharacterized protein BDZ99DRAFT_253876 [Mytilinidion resinicola]KAF2813326.1 hypothetical protein BDZ99DRAFT_253876 [Mytilinidion resinicola]